MMDSISGDEQLLLRSFDDRVKDSEMSRLSELLQNDFALRRRNDQYVQIRNMMKRDTNATFGPFFGERIVHVLKQRKENIDFLVFSFFKKYQLLVLGVLVALLILNLWFADKISIAGIFGIDNNDEDIFSIDAYKNLPQ